MIDHVIDHIFGFDFFIAYTRKDSSSYATNLADELRRLGFKCFLDKTGFEAGDRLTPATTRMLRKTAILVLVGSPVVWLSKYVYDEVSLFSQTHRKIIPVDIDATLEKLEADHRLRSLLQDRIRINETLEALEKGPSNEVINNIVNSFKGTRQDTRQKRAFGIAALVFAVIATAAVFFAIQAEKRRVASLSRELAATALMQLSEAPDRSALLAAEAVQSEPTHEAVAALGQAVEYPQLWNLKGHESAVYGPSFSSNGELIVTTGETEQEARVWKANGGKGVAVLRGHNGTVYHAAFSPDGKLIVTGSHDKTARVWDATTGKELQVLPGHKGDVSSVSFSPHGEWVMTASSDGVRIWETATGKRKKLLGKYSPVVTSATFSSNGKWIITGHINGTARIWDFATGRQVKALSAHKPDERTQAFNRFMGSKSDENPVEVAVSPDSQWIVTVGLFGYTAKVWETKTGRLVSVFDAHRESIKSAAFSPDSKSVLTFSRRGEDRRVRVWDAKTGIQHSVYHHEDEINSATFSPDGKWIVSSSDDKTAHIWDVETSETIAILRGHTQWVQGAIFSPDGKRIVTTSTDQTVRVWDAQTHKELVRHWQPVSVAHSSFSLDGTRVVTYDQEEVVWDFRTKKELSRPKEVTGVVNHAAFSPNGKLIVIASDDASLGVWDAESGEKVRAFQGHEKGVNQGTFSPDGTLIASASGDTTARVWKVDNGNEIRKLPHPREVWDVAFSPDGKFVATASEDQTARVWEVETGKQLSTLRAHTMAVIRVVFSPDGKRIATASRDQTVRIWEVPSGKEISVFYGHASSVISIAFSPDGKWVVTASKDETVRLWETESGIEVSNLPGGEFLWSVSFSRAGTLLISANIVRERVCAICTDVSTLISLARAKASRDLTGEERRRYLHEEQDIR